MRYFLKVYEKNRFQEIEVSEDLFPSNAIKENDKSVTEYLNGLYPNWQRVVVIKKFLGFTQRHLIERKS